MERKAIILSLLGAIAIGAYPVWPKLAFKNGLDALSFSLFSVIFSALFLAVFFQAKIRKGVGKSRKVFPGLFLLGAVASGTSALTFFVGVSMTGASNAGFLINLSVLFTPLFAFFLISERLSNKAFFAIAVVVAGAFLLTTHGVFASPSVGDALIVFAALQLGFSNVLAKKLMKDLDSGIVASFRFFFGAVFLCAVILPVVGVRYEALLSNLGFVVGASLGSCASMVFLYKAFDIAGPSLPLVVFQLSGVFSALFAFWFLSESLFAVQLLGAALVLIGGIMITKERALS